VIRIAAAADVHVGPDSVGKLRPVLTQAATEADVLLLGGDLTKMGHPDEALVLADELDGIELPVIAVLGNHDHHSDRPEEVRRILEDVGVRVLEGEAEVVELAGQRLAVAGVKGFGGGFVGGCVSDFGEPEMKAFARHAADRAAALEGALKQAHDADPDIVVALLHYSPVADTLAGEPPQIHAFLGSYLLAQAIDRVGADLCIHGHAHRGVEKGTTPGGVRVRNVAQPVIRAAYKVFCLEPSSAQRAERRDPTLAGWR
jgi:Icc-related predicted phosphoesterase